jgi:hypothetical protein
MSRPNVFFKPSVERLEDRNAPSYVTNTATVTDALGVQHQFTDTIWDATGDSTWATDLASQVTQAASRQTATNTFYNASNGVADFDTWDAGVATADAAFDTFLVYNGNLAYYAADNYGEPTMPTSNPGPYGTPAEGGTLAQAKADVAAQKATLKTTQDRVKAITDDVNSSGTIIAGLKAIYYGSEASQLRVTTKSCELRLNWVKQYYGDNAFKP